eukprot:350678-Chlamydomonas_euryale.AAC.3
MKRPSTRCHTRCRGMGVNGLREAPPSFSLNVITQITYVLRVHVRNYVSKSKYVRTAQHYSVVYAYKHVRLGRMLL